MSDDQRECLIRSAGEQMLAWHAEYERTGCFAQLATAHFWRRQMHGLIAGHSQEQVSRMELQRGLV